MTVSVIVCTVILLAAIAYAFGRVMAAIADVRKWSETMICPAANALAYRDDFWRKIDELGERIEKIEAKAVVAPKPDVKPEKRVITPKELGAWV